MARFSWPSPCRCYPAQLKSALKRIGMTLENCMARTWWQPLTSDMFLATLPTVRASCPEYLPYRVSPWRWRGTVAAHHERDLSRFHPPEHDGLWLCRPCRPAAGPSASPTRRRGADHGAVDRHDHLGLVAHPGGDGSRVDLASLHCRPLWRATRHWSVGIFAGRLVACRRGPRQPGRGERAPVVACDRHLVWARVWYPIH